VSRERITVVDLSQREKSFPIQAMRVYRCCGKPG
jgi:hypothetical protein